MNSRVAVNPERCIGCRTCEAACIECHDRAGKQRHPRLTLVTLKDKSAMAMCHHCEDAPCMLVCPVGVIKREGRAVVVDEQRCIGCRMCAIACPYGAMHPSGTSVAGSAGTMYKTPTNPRGVSPLIAWEIGVLPSAVKCDLCQGVADEPQCVSHCLSGALELIEGEEVESRATRRRSAEAEARSFSLQSAWKVRRQS